MNQRGFTLIELIITLVLIGILIITVGPRLISFSSDSKVARVRSLHGMLKSAVDLARTQAYLTNKFDNDINIDTDLGLYQYYRGYPETCSEATTPYKFFIETFVDLGEADNETRPDSGTRIAEYGKLKVYENNNVSRVGYGTGNLQADACYAEYRHTIRTQSFNLVTTGC